MCCPVPATPTVAPARRGLFEYLEAATAPPVPVASAPSGGGEATAGAPRGVHVISNKRIGGYQVATLGADSDAGALSKWLAAHHYTLPDGAGPIIASYLRRGWSFVAVRLARKAAGALDPLDIRFASKRAIYPMRLEQLGTEPVSVDLWVVGDAAVSVPPLGETYSGAVAKLHPAVPGQFKRYLDGEWITRTQADDLEPSTLTRDFVALPATSPSGYRAKQSTIEFLSPGTTEPKWWVWLLLGFGLTALVAFIVVMVKRA